MISDSKNGYPKGYYYDSVNINNATLGYNEIFDGEKEVGNLLWFVIVGDFLFNDSLVTIIGVSYFAETLSFRVLDCFAGC